MRQIEAAILAGCVLTLTLSASASSETIPVNSKDQKQAEEDRLLVATAFRAGQNEGCRKVLDLLTPRLKKKPPIESEAVAVQAYGMAANCSSALYYGENARSYFLTLTGYRSAPDEAWRLRLRTDLEASDFRTAVATIEAMNKSRITALNDTPMGWFGQLYQALDGQTYEQERGRLLAVMTSDAYTPSEPLSSKDGFRRAYAEYLQRAGQIDKAAEMVAAIDNPVILINLRADPRFKTMVPKGYDERAATEKDLQKTRAAIQRQSDALGPLMEGSRTLRGLGRPEEALGLLKAAKQRPGGTAGYKNARAGLPWWWDALGWTYRDLGDYSQMVDAFHRGALLAENGGVNVSQVINLAQGQIDFGKPQDALATIAEFKLPTRSMSPYGAMEMRYARGCASALAGQTRQAKADLDYMTAHEKDGPYPLANLLLCMKEMDRAAELFIRMLGDPQKSAETLLKLGDYDPPSAAQPISTTLASLAVLRERPDVRAAIERAGGIQRIHLRRDTMW